MTSEADTRSRWILAAVALALFCVQIDYFAMNLALPRIAAEFDRSATDLQWLVSAYMLALGAFMVPAGRIGDIFGRRRALLCGIALFGVASVACALAPSALLLIAFRVLQGIGAAFIFPVSVSVLTNAYGSARAGKSIGTAYGIAALGNAAGPLVGGLLTDSVGWRWIFWLNVPLTLVSLAIAARTVTESFDETAPRHLDVTGLALISTGIGLFTLTFDRAPEWGWVSGWTLGAFAVSVATLAAFVVVERRARWPLVDLALLGNPRFTLLVVAGTVANVAYVVTIFVSTLFMQQVLGLDPLAAGLAFLGPSVGAAAGGWLAGRLAARRSPALVMGTTIVLAAFSVAALALSGGWIAYLAALTAGGATLGLVYAFTTVATQAVVRPERAGEAAGITLTVLVSVAGVGVAVAGTALEVLQSNGFPAADASQTVLTVLAALLLAAGAAVLWTTRPVPSRPAA
ncbi:MFS transporter [Mycolicibacterium flavescens]|uniref:MFS transporter n=1 Tax=Mycolicibacterium flavescens TaxID=1776 RepID=A0A1E3RLN7_MYCFV|nr:MFS transporter [Mycolicibacterium flavescens]MCV7281867.1 MFS transporter [Mycolicibacterium flavescens]ODQ90758.1 MFS transporter [Mycolicibacterium flavescens]